MAQSHVADLQIALMAADGLVDRLCALLDQKLGRIVLTTSFGLEDQALTHAAVQAMARTGGRIELLTLDTGRIFPETLDVWAQTEHLYGVRIAALAPDAPAARGLLAEQGADGFRRSVEARRACCEIRKIMPLRQALQGADLWITGLRADQSEARAATPFAVWDDHFGIVKAQPLADWSRAAVAGYVAAHQVPMNALHARGFLSIGCAPCTRAVAGGEPERAGRWWWEQQGHGECGLHSRKLEPV